MNSNFLFAPTSTLGAAPQQSFLRGLGRGHLALSAAVLLATSGCKEESQPATPVTPTAAASQPANGHGASSQPAAAADVRARVDEATARLKSSEAGRLILKAVNFHGGLDAWFAQRAIAFDYNYVPAGDATKAKNSRQTIDLLKSRAYHDVKFPATGTIAFDGKTAWSKLDKDVPFPARFWALTPYYFVSMPFVLSDAGVNLAISNDTAQSAGFEAADVVAVTFGKDVGDAPDDTYHIYLDKTSGQVLGVRYTVTYAPFFAGSDKKRSAEKVIHYGDVVEQDGIKLARKHDFYAFDPAQKASTTLGAAKGELLTNATVGDVVIGAKFDERRLSPPAGAVVDESLTKVAK